WYLPGRDPWVVREFGDAIRSTLSPALDPDWSPHDLLLVPLRNGQGAIVATLVLDDPADRSRPSLTRVRTVELFGQQVAAMLEQATLRDLAERRARRLQRLHEMGTLLAGSLDEGVIIRSLGRKLEATLSPARLLILAPTDDGGLTTHTAFDDGVAPPPPDAVMELAARAARACRISTDGALTAVPAIVVDRAVCVLVVEGADGAPSDADDRELLQTVAAQAAAAISNARLYAESQRQRRQTEALADVARAVGESLRLDAVLNLILRHATALLRTEGATVALLRGDTLEVTAGIGTGKLLVGSRPPLHGSMSGRAVRTGSSIIGQDVTSDPDAYQPHVEKAHIRNTLIVPLLAAKGPVGALSVFNRDMPFTPLDAEVLQRLADQVAVAVVNARLFEELAEASREWVVAFDAIGSGMVLLDRAGRIQRTNARARALLDESWEDALLGRTLHETLFGETEPCPDCLHLTAIRDGTLQRGTHDDRRRGRIFDLTAAPHPLGGAVVTFDDITAHRSLAERHRRVVETTRDGVVITDPARRIIFANPAALALFGRGEEIIGTPSARTAPPEERTLVATREEAALAGAPQSYESVVLRPDGERRIVAVSTAPLIELGEVTGIVASLRDVTDERRARDAVAQSEARYRNLFDSASESIFTVDLRGDLTSVNEATCTLAGQRRDELLGLSVNRFLDPDEVDAVRGHFEVALAGGTARYECHLRRPTGERRLLSLTSTPVRRSERVIGVLCIGRDVTDERAREEALERSEARYTHLAESAPDAIFTLDLDGRLTDANQSLEEAVGIPRLELVGRSFAELVDAGSAAAEVTALLRDAFSGEQSRTSIKY
ncbi:MAG: PAS domain S-box protein, partial [Gemmatimonadaceae bacterium]|nr:PAS domain S-box protein [Gemmatimonadaceae bacterium]